MSREQRVLMEMIRLRNVVNRSIEIFNTERDVSYETLCNMVADVTESHANLKAMIARDPRCVVCATDAPTEFRYDLNDYICVDCNTELNEWLRHNAPATAVDFLINILANEVFHL